MASLTVVSRPLSRLRAEWIRPRRVLYAVAALSVLTNLYLALRPDPTPITIKRVGDTHNRLEERFAENFASAYLTYDSQDPDAHTDSLAAFTQGGNLEPDAGLQPPTDVSQTVFSTKVVQSRPTDEGGRAYLVQADIGENRFLYVLVPVARDDAGATYLSGYPALTGGPDIAPPQAPSADLRVEEQDLEEVIGRGLRNYLAGEVSDLRADLADAAEVNPPARKLTLRDVPQTVWIDPGQTVAAEVTATDRQGATYTLRYDVDVEHSDRWRIRHIAIVPNT